MIIVAYDLDGVIFPLLKRHKPFYKYSGPERKVYEAKRLYYYENAPCILRPEEKEFYIISARQEKYKDITLKWLQANKIQYKGIYLMDAALKFENIVEHKSMWLKELGITKYYEDDLKIIKYLHKVLPSLELVEIVRTPISVKTDLQVEIPNCF